jgi:alcohol dehydrogenase (NADP+)
LDLAGVAPLLCAGITTWSPLVHYGVKKGDKVGVLGLGGLGHIAVKFAKAMGCKVTVLSHSKAKEELALNLGAESFLNTSHEGDMKDAERSFDYILDTISGQHILEYYMKLLKTDGTFILVGASPEPLPLSPFSLILKRNKIGGSLVGGIKETQEMLDFCGKHNIVCDVELVSCDYANKAWERMLNCDVKFRFVLDVEKTLLKKELQREP